MNSSTDLRKPWQRKRWIQALAILLGYIPPLAVLISQLFGEPVTAQGYTVVISVTLNALIMVLWHLRFRCIFHLIVAHYLYDAIQLVPAIILMMLGGWRM